MKNRILVVSDAGSDLSEVLIRSCGAQIINFRTLGDTALDGFYSVALLGGNGDAPIILDAAARTRLENYREAGGRVFGEFIASLGQMYAGEPERLTHHRSVFTGGARVEGVDTGDLFDTHYNELLAYHFRPDNIEPLLVCHPYLCAHTKVKLPARELLCGTPSLWLDGEKTMVCAFRLCNFNRARLAPLAKWRALVRYIAGWLNGSAVEAAFPQPVCTHDANRRLDDCIQRGLRWFTDAGILVEDGRRGAREGFSHHIDAKDGRQHAAPQIRTDCCGETGGAFLLDALLTGSQRSLAVADNLEDFIFDYLQVKDGPYKGMVRWSESAWGTCYQDDVARAVLPTLLRARFSKSDGARRRLDDAFAALDFLAATTGTDGLRPNRTDCATLTPAETERIRTTESGRASAHYNAYYHAALLQAYQICKKQAYFDTARKGLKTIMALYPDTLREQSETQEMCRLIFPLACLYEASGEDRHKAMLCRVNEDLQRRWHPSGGYAEWDTGYRANCSRREAGECSLLAENGDPVADLLYSVNWLPLGFAYAYYATGDRMFFGLWGDIARFFCLAQIQSEDKAIDGAWARAFDMDLREIAGVPHDVGWAPCSIESGWTVAEILTGLMFMKLIYG